MQQHPLPLGVVHAQPIHTGIRIMPTEAEEYFEVYLTGAASQLESGANTSEESHHPRTAICEDGFTRCLLQCFSVLGEFSKFS